MFPSDAEVILLAILTVATYSLVGLLAIWAGLGRPHWFLRVAVVGGILLLLLLIPAYEPLLLFSIQSAVVILPLMLLKSFRRRNQPVGPDGGAYAGALPRLGPQFSLSDLLLLTVVVAVIVAVVVNRNYVQGVYDFTMPVLGVPTTLAQGWTAFSLCGLALGISTLVAAWVVLGRRRLWMRLIVLCLVPTSAVMAAWLALARTSGWLARSERSEPYSAEARPAGGATRPILRRVAKLATVLLSLVVLLPPVATFCVLVAPAPDPPETVLPDPNGYDDLMKAARALEGGSVPDTDTATAKQLQAFLTRHARVLDAARTGLDRKCIVPLRYSTADLDSKSIGRLQGLRELARAFLAEGKAAEMEGRPDEAAESYLDAIRLGQEGARGGMVIDWLVGQAIEGIALEPLTDLRETLTAERCNDLMNALQTLDGNREPLEDVIARDQLWERVAYDHWTVELMRMLSTIAGADGSFEGALQATALRHQARFRLLICGLALRAYCVENGDPPEKLADLVPEYLTKVPQDPHSGKPLVYRRDAKGYVLYSVGPDGRDNGGQPGEHFEPGTDMLLDKPPEGEEE